MQFEKEKLLKVVLNLSPQLIKEKYGDRLQPEIEGPLYDVISKLFKEVIGINILIPSEFKSSKNHEAIKCSVRA
jgi:structure-specific recognition protein 1